MGQKVHPESLRLGYIHTWKSRWYAEKDYKGLLHEDLWLRDFTHKRYPRAGVSRVIIERAANKLKINIHTSRPGVVIGRRGAEVEKFRKDVEKLTKREVYVNIQEVARPEADAQCVAENIAVQLEKRVMFRRAMKRAVETAHQGGCKGIKVMVAGRLNGREIARTEWYLEGKLPLHTFRADIDYGFSQSYTTYGVIGVKVWVYNGDIMDVEEAHQAGL
jgi:small subunit ribosomal protein S3